ncbi:hypothetical protein AB0F88_04500 [Streptosporangium sp. NPDC023963]|uniref:hypothetical protein n=1 Tax=Streptosporangium sp. NPDC023963 TaxID=3155608 RepID=UPI003446084F
MAEPAFEIALDEASEHLDQLTRAASERGIAYLTEHGRRRFMVLPAEDSPEAWQVGTEVQDEEEDSLETLIGSAPGLSAATDLQALRNEWRR